MTDTPNLPPTDEIPETFIPPNRDPRWAALAAPFPADEIEKLPKQLSKDERDKYQCRRGTKASADGFYCGGYHARSIHLDYVGHAGVTTRLNSVDPTWTWEPMYRDVPHDILLAAISTGNEAIVRQVIDNAPMLSTQGGLWIRLTVLGVTRPGFGDAAGKNGPDAVKEVIGDAIRNAGMRFGIATYLWSKSTKARAAHAEAEDDDTPDVRQNRQQRPTPPPAGVDGSVEETAAQRTMRQRREADQLRYGQLADAADRALGERADSDAASQQAALDQVAAAHRTPEGQRALARDELAPRRVSSVNGHAAGQLLPPSDDEPVHVAGARAVQRIKEQRAAERGAERQQRQAQQPAPRKAASGDPEAFELVDAIVRTSRLEHLRQLWAQGASIRPSGRETDIRGYLDDAAIFVLAPQLDAMKVDPGGPIKLGSLVVAAQKHIDAESMSIHDHVAAETADINPTTGQAVNPPADAVAPTR